MGKSTISMAIFNSYVSHYQRVHIAAIAGPWLLCPYLRIQVMATNIEGCFKVANVLMYLHQRCMYYMYMLVSIYTMIYIYIHICIYIYIFGIIW